MYIELDHDLVPGKLSDINVDKNLPTGKGPPEKIEWGFGGMTQMNVKKYEIQHGDICQAVLSQNAKRIQVVNKNKEVYQSIQSHKHDSDDKAKEALESKSKDLSEYEAVIGSESSDLYYDHDWGFFSAILACYNNHWVLRTSPDDWWNVIVRNVAQAIDENGHKNKVREFFVEHSGKEAIEITLPGRLNNIDYSWLFNQFSEQIHHKVKKPGYVDAMQAEFSTTTPDQLIASQTMLMSSIQKYFDFCISTRCGIPGVEMKGTLEDWNHLIKKTEKLKKMLKPIMNEISLSKWFKSTWITTKKLLHTYKGNPDKKWWGHILSWNEMYGSGSRSRWSGWMIDFLMAGKAETPQDFQSGMVSVPVTIVDEINGPPIRDVGQLVAGTIGYIVEESDRAPVVEAKQGWLLFLPKGSPVIPRMK